MRTTILRSTEMEFLEELGVSGSTGGVTRSDQSRWYLSLSLKTVIRKARSLSEP